MARYFFLFLFSIFLVSCGGGGGGTSTTVVPSKTLTSIQVTPSASSLMAGITQQFTATGTFSDGSTQNITSSVTWVSSNPAAMSFSTTTPGLATIAANANVGQLSITASMSGITGNTPVTVTPLIITGLSVDCDTGCPGTLSLPLGATRKLVAKATVQGGATVDVSTIVTWNSSVSTNVSVDTTGLVKGLQMGSASITATSGNFNASKQVTVTAAVATSVKITPVNPSVAKTTTQQFTATATFSDGSGRDVTADPQTAWSSDNTAVLAFQTAAQPGLATAITAGSTKVHVVFFSQLITDATNVTVTPAPIVAVFISPINPLLPQGQAQQFSMSAVYADQTTGDVTSSTTWSSSNTAVATINGSGLASGVVSSGQTTITGAVSGTAFSAQTTIVAAASAPVARFAFVDITHADSLTGTSTHEIDTFPIDPTTGFLASAPSSTLATTTGVNLVLDPQGQYLFSNDGASITTYSINQTTGLLLSVSTFPLAGASNFTIDPQGEFLFASASAGLYSLKLNRTTGALTQAPGSPFVASGRLFTAGKFLYAAAPNIFGFSIDRTTGSLASVPGSPFVTGANTQGIAGDSQGRFLYAANYSTNDVDGSSNVMTFSIDATSGALTLLGNNRIHSAFQPAKAYVDPLDRYVFSGDLGGGLKLFSIDSNTGMLTASNSGVGGTQSFAGDKSGRFAYTTVPAFSSNAQPILEYSFDALQPAVHLNKSSPLVIAGDIVVLSR